MFSRAHYRQVSPPADTARQIAERIATAAALKAVYAELRAAFPVVTVANASAALDFQAARNTEAVTAACDRVAELFAALDQYAARNGRNWKSKLRAEWQLGTAGQELQELRNASYFGPAGLAAYIPGK